MMLAYRFARDDGVVVADNDDDGEHGAGRVLAHLLEMMAKNRGGKKGGKKGGSKKGGKKKGKKKGEKAAAAESAAAATAGAAADTSATGAVVVVSRWYGGTHLGPSRFKHISNCAREALEKAGVRTGL